MRSAVVAFAVLAALGAAATLTAETAPAERPEPPNVRIEIVLAPDPGEARYEMITFGDGSPGELNDTTRVPIRITTFGAEAGDGATPMTSYQYQDVGFRASLGATVLADGRIRLRGHLEQSSISDPGVETRGPGLPEIAAYSHNLRAVLESGVPLEVAGYAGNRSNPLRIRLLAKVLP